VRVLIVDDEEDVREMLRELPELEGFEVYTARDAQDALSKVAVEPPCAVVLDLMMPVMDGFEVYRRLKADPKLQALPIFVATSAPSRAPRRDGGT
jgi:CheY-like chemotaxis protein